MSGLRRIAVVGGGGMVGAATVNALVLMDVAAEILIVDVVELAARGQALDIADASTNSRARVRVGTYAEAGQADIVIITAGYPQKPGETRAQLLGMNKKIIKSICDSMQPIRPDMKILLVANPVDVLAALAQRYSGLPARQVFGSGTYLDSCRLRNHLAEIMSVSPQSVNAYVLGEHGDRQFVAWSSATVAAMPLLKHARIAGQDLDKIREDVMRKAYVIIEAKRSTYFGIGRCAAYIAQQILADSNMVLPLSHYVDQYQSYIAWPCSVNAHGIADTVDVPLSDKERGRLDTAVAAIKEMIAEALAD